MLIWMRLLADRALVIWGVATPADTDRLIYSNQIHLAGPLFTRGLALGIVSSDLWNQFERVAKH